MSNEGWDGGFAAGFGECRLTRIDDPGGSRLRIVHADPRILICPEILDEVRAGSSWATVDDDRLRIEAENRTVVYRIAEYLPEHGAYIGEWPD